MEEQFNEHVARMRSKETRPRFIDSVWINKRNLISPIDKEGVLAKQKGEPTVPLPTICCKTPH